MSRSEEREREYAELRQELRQDIGDWPRAFGDHLLPRYERAIDQSLLGHRRHRVLGRMQRMRGDRSREKFVDAVLPALEKFRSGTQKSREARGSTNSARRIAAERLESARVKLLEVLWAFGRRRITRAELRPFLEHKLAERCRPLEGLIVRLRDAEERQRQQLDAEVYVKGRRVGQPLDPGYRKLFAAKMNRTAARRAQYEAELAELTTDPDPMRAAGVWPAKARAT